MCKNLQKFENLQRVLLCVPWRNLQDCIIAPSKNRPSPILSACGKIFSAQNWRRAIFQRLINISYSRKHTTLDTHLHPSGKSPGAGARWVLGANSGRILEKVPKMSKKGRFSSKKGHFLRKKGHFLSLLGSRVRTRP